MPHISSEKIDKKIFDTLFQQMVYIQTGLTKKEVSGFIENLLTETEKVMMTKRCAAVLMFNAGCSAYEVWNTLKLSPSTAANIKLSYENGAFDHLIHIFKHKKQEKEEFMKALNKALRLGMPSMGKDRWEALNGLM